MERIQTIRTCTANLVSGKGYWNVGGMTGSSIKGYNLTIFRVHNNKHFYAVKNMNFKDADSANQWAYEHGYLQRFYSGVWCRKCRVLHRFISGRSSFCLGEKSQTWPPPDQAQIELGYIKRKKEYMSKYPKNG